MNFTTWFILSNTSFIWLRQILPEKLCTLRKQKLIQTELVSLNGSDESCSLMAEVRTLHRSCPRTWIAQLNAVKTSLIFTLKTFPLLSVLHPSLLHNEVLKTPHDDKSSISVLNLGIKLSYIRTFFKNKWTKIQKPKPYKAICLACQQMEDGETGSRWKPHLTAKIQHVLLCLVFSQRRDSSQLVIGMLSPHILPLNITQIKFCHYRSCLLSSQNIQGKMQV